MTVTIFIFCYTLWQDKNLNTLEHLENTAVSYRNENNIQSSKPLIPFYKKYISGELPYEWSIEEYEGSESIEILSPNIYKGFTGFKIRKGDITVVELKAVDGLGGHPACQNIYKFSDTDPLYVENKQQEWSVFTGVDATKNSNGVIDLSGKVFESTQLFGRNTRRIDSNLYWDSNNADTYFNPLCGIKERLLEFEGVKFYLQKEDSSLNIVKYEINTYQVELDKNLSQSDYLIVDTILKSIRYLK